MSRPVRMAPDGRGGFSFDHAAVSAATGHRIDLVFPIDVLLRAHSGFDDTRDIAGYVSDGGTTEALLSHAQKNWSIELGSPSSKPFVHIDSNPHYLVGESCLSIMGLMTGAAVLCHLSQGVVA